jgi:hypothetical protein
VGKFERKCPIGRRERGVEDDIKGDRIVTGSEGRD